MNIKEHQKFSIKALEELKKICDRYHINFFLLSGSALGAARNGKMIPWDDDIDVGFLYNDWIVIKRVLSIELDNKFAYFDNETKLNFPRMFGKILYKDKTCVDLFLIACWTKNELLSILYWTIRKISVESYYLSINYKKIEKKKTIKKSIIKILIKVIYTLIHPFTNSKTFISICRWNEKTFNGRNDCYINLYSIYGRKKEVIEKEWVKNPIKIFFENDYYFIFSNYEDYLNRLYGKNWQIPINTDDNIERHKDRFY